MASSGYDKCRSDEKAVDGGEAVDAGGDDDWSDDKVASYIVFMKWASWVHYSKGRDRDSTFKVAASLDTYGENLTEADHESVFQTMRSELGKGRDKGQGYENKGKGKGKDEESMQIFVKTLGGEQTAPDEDIIKARANICIAHSVIAKMCV